LVERLAPAASLQSHGVAMNHKPVVITGETLTSDIGEIKIKASASASRRVGSSQVIAAQKVDYVVGEFPDGLQIASVARSHDANTFSYSFPGKTLEKLADGSVVVRNSAFGAPLALIDQPWARDADGGAVATTFAVRGDTLTQEITTTVGTHFPVVADPRLRWAWYGASIDFTRKDTNLLSAGAGGCAAVAALIPDATASKVVAVSCGLMAVWAGYASSEGKCVSVKITWAALATPWAPGLGIIPWITNCYA